MLTEPSPPSAALPEPADVPLCVDLDGTLLATDTLYESLLALARTRPGELWRVPSWLLRGRAAFKRTLALRVLPDVALLPYRKELLEHLRLQRAHGRRIVLATGADELVARAVATHTGLFDEVLASDGRTNLSGARKSAALQARFGRFDYVGDSRADMAVWRHARRALVAGPSPRLVAKARASAESVEVFSTPRRPLRTLARAVRVHQWVKNLLVLVPILAAHRILERAVVVPTLLALVGFCLCASAGYLLNDMLDLEADRRDPHKRSRPLASGALSIATALALCPLLLVAGLAIGWSVAPVIAGLLLLHFFATSVYSLHWKRVLVLDVLVLAGLYTLRIFTGAAAGHVTVSPWLLAVSTFVFLSLAMVKRASELRRVRARGEPAAPGRSYQADDLDVVTMLGGASGYMTVLVLALYIHSPDVTALYSHPERLWALCPLLLYWVSRIWILTARGEISSDPVAFALKDRASHVIGAAALAVGWLAS